MSNGDLNKAIADVLNNMDKKTLQENLNKALDVLKNGNTEELAKQISSLTGSQQGVNPGTTDNAALDKMNINTGVMKNMNTSDLEKLLKYVGSHGNEIKDKLKDIVK